MTFRIHLDDELCTGHGRCYAVAPDLLTDDEALAAFTDRLWSRLWEVADPGAAQEPRGRPAPSRALLRQDRVEVYAARRGRGERLWAADAWCRWRRNSSAAS